MNHESRLDTKWTRRCQDVSCVWWKRRKKFFLWRNWQLYNKWKIATSLRNEKLIALQLLIHLIFPDFHETIEWNFLPSTSDTLDFRFLSHPDERLYTNEKKNLIRLRHAMIVKQTMYKQATNNRTRKKTRERRFQTRMQIGEFRLLRAIRHHRRWWLSTSDSCQARQRFLSATLVRQFSCWRLS